MTQFIASIIIFALFFIGVGLVQLVGYRNMMCSCKARLYMQARQKGIQSALQAQNVPELITQIELPASDNNSTASNSPASNQED